MAQTVVFPAAEFSWRGLGLLSVLDSKLLLYVDTCFGPSCGDTWHFDLIFFIEGEMDASLFWRGFLEFHSMCRVVDL